MTVTYKKNTKFELNRILRLDPTVFNLSLTHTYTQTNFQKTLFWTQGTPKHLNLLKNLNIENFDRKQYLHYLTVV